MRTLALLMLALMALLAPCSGAFAHASLIRAEPADGAVLATAPARLSLTFNEPVSPLVLRLIGPDGSPQVLGDYELRDTELDIAAPPGIANGTHVLSWRVISEDGHPVGGSVVFSIGAPSTVASRRDAEPVDWPVRIAIWTARLAVYAGLFFGIGGVFFLAWMAPGSRSGATLCTSALLLGLVAMPLSVGLLGVDALDLPLSGVALGIAWQTGFATSYGTTAVLAELALLAGVLAPAFGGPFVPRALTALAVLGAGVALAASGHASAAAPQALTRPSVFLHAVYLAFWLGALIPLGLMLWRGETGAPAALRRFSATIPFAVVVLAAAGLALAAVQVEAPGALLTTAYGRVLLVKLALVALLLGLAAANRWRLTGPAERNAPGAGRRLARVVAGEAVLALAILGVVALWRFTPPPRALAAAAAQPAQVHMHAAPAMADLSITPGRSGPVSASIIVMTGDFGPLDAKEVTLVLANPQAGIEPIRKAAIKPGDGTWRVDGFVIPVPGRWTVRIDILVSDFQMESLEGEIEIRP